MLCCRQLEFGDIYASKSWEDADGRRLMLGWAFETAAGCTQQCSAGSPFTDSLVSLSGMQLPFPPNLRVTSSKI